MENRKTKIALGSLGCKLNQAEIEFLQNKLEGLGCQIIDPELPGDIYILNTCTVTQTADRKSRQMINKMRSRNPSALIIAIGCYAEKGNGELTEITGADLALGNKNKLDLPQILIERGYIRLLESTASSSAKRRTRSFIKIQDGCSHFCSYCVVPYVRGTNKSIQPEEIIREVKKREGEGYCEVVLTGTEIGSYKSGDMDLEGLIERILETTDIPRLRISSLQPQEISPDLVRLWLNRRLCRHVHLSLQSGSESVLRRMGRRYSKRDYGEAVELIRSTIPEVAITTDVITGFPGETQDEFDESFDFCRDTEFSRIHVFPFSPRKGTRAAVMENQISRPKKKERTDRMLTLAEKSLRKYNQRFTGDTLPVLFERRSKGHWEGLTDNYIKVYVSSGDDLTNRILPVTLVNLMGNGALGSVSS